jgi:hypothetical protein
MTNGPIVMSVARALICFSLTRFGACVPGRHAQRLIRVVIVRPAIRRVEVPQCIDARQRVFTGQFGGRNNLQVTLAEESRARLEASRAGVRILRVRTVELGLPVFRAAESLRCSEARRNTQLGMTRQHQIVNENSMRIL